MKPRLALRPWHALAATGLLLGALVLAVRPSTGSARQPRPRLPTPVQWDELVPAVTLGSQPLPPVNERSSEGLRSFKEP